MARMRAFGVLATLGLALQALPASAADHLDGAAVKTDHATDIADVYAWSTADKVNLIMTVFPQATTASKFSTAAAYVFHTSSRAAFGSATTTPLDIICTFDAAQKVSCWVGSDKTNYVSGDASAAAGISSSSAKVKVHTGLHDDPFFFNLAGFNKVREIVKGAAASLTFDTDGCPALDVATAGALVTQLKQSPTGGAPANFFAGLNSLAIVIQVDKAVLTAGGPILGVWAGTHKLSAN